MSSGPVVETHLKKSNWKTRQHGPKAHKQTKVSGGSGSFIRVEKLISQSRAASNNLKRMHRLQKKPTAPIKIDPTRRTAKLILVVRCGGTFGVDPVIRNALKFLNLQKTNSASFVKASPAMEKILNNLRDFVCWGSPDISIVQQFIQKRGYANIVKGEKPLPLSDNKMIEDQLGARYNIVCLEDIVHEISTVGPAFKFLTKTWLAPFKIPTPKGGWKIKIGNAKKASHIKKDQFGVDIIEPVHHNGYHEPAEFKAIVTPMI